MATGNIDERLLSQSHSLSLSLYISESISPHSVASFSLSLSVILWYYCPSVRLVRFFGWVAALVCVFLWGVADVVCDMGFMLWGVE